jgi:hypothetical protein
MEAHMIDLIYLYWRQSGIFCIIVDALILGIYSDYVQVV